MALVPRQLSKVPGLAFFKLMGSGQGKVFSLSPDWSRYALLATWRSPEEATSFINDSAIMEAFRQKSTEVWTMRMYPIKSQGVWSGTNPFQPIAQALPAEAPLAVLTRASLRLGALRQFWKYAPESARSLDSAQGLVFSMGVGELPFVRQATLSVWENMDAMRAFAYKTASHREAMQQKVQQNWYWEELFARFVIVGSEGSNQGRDPFKSLNLFTPSIHPAAQ
jgi:heme-degrading monooxygenase HmoA